MKTKKRTQAKSLIGLSLALLMMTTAGIGRAEVNIDGLWFPYGRGVQDPAQTPYNEYAQALHDDYQQKFSINDDPGGFCIRPGLPRSIWGAPFPVEIIQKPEFITMLWEGYFQYRKIYMEGYPRPDPILHTRMGYSVGHWEGDTLVVKTTHLREYPYMTRLPNTDTATVEERITVQTREEENGETRRYLINEMTLSDPRLFTEPVTVKGELRFSPDTPILEYTCSESIWDEYLNEKGLTPPVFE